MILREGLRPLPRQLRRSDITPLSFWINGTCASVQFLFHFTDPGGIDRPADVTFDYIKTAESWEPIEHGTMWSGNRSDGIESLAFMRQSPHLDIESSSYSADKDAIPGHPAIVVSGFHSPAVATIRLIQGMVSQEWNAGGHFGGWTVCTPEYRPLRVEGLSAEGTVLGHLDVPGVPATLDS